MYDTTPRYKSSDATPCFTVTEIGAARSELQTQATIIARNGGNSSTAETLRQIGREDMRTYLYLLAMGERLLELADELQTEPEQRERFETAVNQSILGSIAYRGAAIHHQLSAAETIELENFFVA